MYSTGSPRRVSLELGKPARAGLYTLLPQPVGNRTFKEYTSPAERERASCRQIHISCCEVIQEYEICCTKGVGVLCFQLGNAALRGAILVLATSGNVLYAFIRSNDWTRDE